MRLFLFNEKLRLHIPQFKLYLLSFYSLIVVAVLPVPTTDSCNDLHVLHPIIPSADNPTLFWYCIVAFLVCVPNTPSNPPVLYPSVFRLSCAMHTYAPLEPCLISGYPPVLHAGVPLRLSKCTHVGVSSAGST